MDRGVKSGTDHLKDGEVLPDDGHEKTPEGPQGENGIRIPSKSSIFDYIFLLRPMILIPVWTFFLLGAVHATASAGEARFTETLIMGLLSFTLLIGAVYILNQITDREADRANEKLFLLSHGVISTRAAWIEAVVLTAASFTIGFVYLEKSFIIILVLSALLGAAYSVEPARFKGRPVLDVLSNAIGNGILNTLAGWVAVGAPLDRAQILLPYPFAVAGVHLATTIADIPGDRKNSLRTSGTALGERNAAVISTILMATAASVAAIVGNNTAFYSSIISLPLFLVPARSTSPELIRKKALIPVKWSVVVFSTAAALNFSPYFPWIVVVVLGTRAYYERRFSIKYPGL